MEIVEYLDECAAYAKEQHHIKAYWRYKLQNLNHKQLTTNDTNASYGTISVDRIASTHLYLIPEAVHEMRCYDFDEKYKNAHRMSETIFI